MDEYYLTEILETYQEQLSDAKDEIARLTAENAKLKDANRWIPVGERLPEKTDWYPTVAQKERNLRRYTTFGYFSCNKKEWEVETDKFIFWRENLPLPAEEE